MADPGLLAAAPSSQASHYAENSILEGQPLLCPCLLSSVTPKHTQSVLCGGMGVTKGRGKEARKNVPSVEKDNAELSGHLS